MSLYQQHINESLIDQHRQDKMREGSTERALRAMRAEESDRVTELTQTVSVVPRPSRLRHALSTLLNNLISFL